jgi:hypothetical protein
MPFENLLTKAVDKAKLIGGTITLLAGFAAGSWSLITDVFIPRAEAELHYKRLDIDTSYNKAFRLEQRLERLERDQGDRELSEEEKRIHKRYVRQLEEIDAHIYKLENQLFSPEESD